MRLTFTPRGWEDYSSRLATDRRVLVRINRLIEDTLGHPTEGIGKPEPLRHVASGAWSRRISEERRLVYAVEQDEVIVLQARFHYE